MKIALASKEQSLNAQMDNSFGRCPCFVIVEVDERKITSTSFIDNTATAQHGGAGMTASQIVGDEGINAVIVQNLGPKAFRVLQELEIETLIGVDGTIRQNVEKFISGELSTFDSPPIRGRRHRR